MSLSSRLPRAPPPNRRTGSRIPRPRYRKAPAPESFSAAFCPLSLERRGVERAALGLFRQVRYERDRRIGSELQLREAHLTDALPHSPLHGPQLALRDAVSRDRKSVG